MLLKKDITPLETICRADKYKMSLTGFTLMEVLVSAVLIAIVLVGLANLFVVGKRYILHNRSRMTGGELGRVFLDPLQMHVRQDTWGTANNCLSNKTNCPTPQTLDNITYTPDYNDITDVAGTNLRRVRLIISWTEPAP
jgi:Tfp pilus assembly protein PilV